MVYEYYNNELAVHSRWLYDEACIVSHDNYKKLLQRGWLKLLRRGCRNTPALVEFESMRPDIKQKVVELAGDPKKQVTRNVLQELVQPDHKAVEFFLAHRKPNGKSLPTEKKELYVTNACILNAITVMLNDHQSKARAMGASKTRIWQNVTSAVNALIGFEHTIPGNYRRVKGLYEKYQREGYSALLHKGEGNTNSNKITGPVADWWVSNYAQPNKPVIPELMYNYNIIRVENDWPELTEQGVHKYLMKSDVKRLWFLGRHGKDEWIKKYGYKTKRDRSNWFPDAYWAIDGTKLDWIHYWDETRGIAAKLKINPLFDVYSEKILGWSYSFTEDHTDHFKALKMGIAESKHRPYLLTYDNQSGHKSSRMQELYSNLVANEKGLHYPHQAYRSSNPVEQLFSRFQQQVLNKFWFSDKQTIKARKLDSLPNREFINEYKHELKTFEELLKWWEFAVHKWNNKNHPKFKESRNEVYNHTRVKKEVLDITEMVSIFWIEETKPITYTKDGLRMRLQGEEYWFEVFNQDNDIDLEFRKKYVGERFHVRYDPELLQHGVQLWQKNGDEKAFISTAQPKRAHEVLPMYQTENKKERWWKDFQTTELEYERDLKELEKIRDRAGVNPKKLIEDQEWEMKNAAYLPKDRRNELESRESLHKL